PEPKFAFKEVHQFCFLDEENDSPTSITKEQAAALATLLKRAAIARMHVVVHCFAGICRSGAVAEVASMVGFTPTERSDTTRIPNVRVKTFLMREFGFTYDSDLPMWRFNPETTTEMDD
ncbi:MAG: hypothetical protein KGM99_15420, partial [Burkholderiales bacterium]|nr:hypothetical protein [Burkholderiales bacterium]